MREEKETQGQKAHRSGISICSRRTPAPEPVGQHTSEPKKLRPASTASIPLVRWCYFHLPVRGRPSRSKVQQSQQRDEADQGVRGQIHHQYSKISRQPGCVLDTVIGTQPTRRKRFVRTSCLVSVPCLLSLPKKSALGIATFHPLSTSQTRQWQWAVAGQSRAVYTVGTQTPQGAPADARDRVMTP